MADRSLLAHFGNMTCFSGETGLGTVKMPCIFIEWRHVMSPQEVLGLMTQFLEEYFEGNPELEGDPENDEEICSATDDEIVCETKVIGENWELYFQATGKYYKDTRLKPFGDLFFMGILQRDDVLSTEVETEWLTFYCSATDKHDDNLCVLTIELTGIENVLDTSSIGYFIQQCYTGEQGGARELVTHLIEKAREIIT